jgi:hypothetical protein
VIPLTKVERAEAFKTLPVSSGITGIQFPGAFVGDRMPLPDKALQANTRLAAPPPPAPTPLPARRPVVRAPVPVETPCEPPPAPLPRRRLPPTPETTAPRKGLLF